MGESAIVFESVSKHYRGAAGYTSLRDDLAVGLKHLLRPGRAVERPTVKALEHITFQIEEGESVALVGDNGAGKTTALKLASRVAYPTSGRIRVRGRVGALIEVGTGMHPELSGRENVQLYGRILGLPGRDISRRFDDIVGFADVGGAIDQPVKQYSSGMQLRLGFAIAAYLDPDIFIVDEAIAVGDAGFQYKCVSRMADLVRAGRTLVFVSHVMSAVETLCERAILLEHGSIVNDGPASQVVQSYLTKVQSQLAHTVDGSNIAGGGMEITRVTLHDAGGRQVDEIPAGASLAVRLYYRASTPVNGPIFSIGLSDGGHRAFTLASMLIDGESPDVLTGEGYVECLFDELPLRPKLYEVWGSVRGAVGFGDIIDWQRLRRFLVTGDVRGQGVGSVSHTLLDAPVALPYSWDIRQEASSSPPTPTLDR
ncbi:MAG TPA: ABC transporter ATP-binding protein [Acidimicrobiales bacterium]|nr:ABC transporter ATP-binding protein [Acidimicrobiales bacterium]